MTRARSALNLATRSGVCSTDDVVERIGKIVAVEHTPERVAKFKAERDKLKGGKP